MKKLTGVLLLLACTGVAHAAPTVYVATQDGKVFVANDDSATLASATPITVPGCWPVDGAADPAGNLVWFASTCGELYSLNVRTLAVTMRVTAPLPVGSGRPMRIAAGPGGVMYLARQTTQIVQFQRDPALPTQIFGVGGRVGALAVAGDGRVFFVDRPEGQGRRRRRRRLRQLPAAGQPRSARQ